MIELPEDFQALHVNPHGTRFWTQTARLTTRLPNGSDRLYFFRVALGDHGMRMLNDEFESMSALYAAAPHFLPKPYV